MSECPACGTALSMARSDSRTTHQYCPECGTPPKSLGVLEKIGIWMFMMVVIVVAPVILGLYRIYEWVIGDE